MNTEYFKTVEKLNFSVLLKRYFWKQTIHFPISYNINHHYTTQGTEFSKNYLFLSKIREEKLVKLKKEFF